MKIDLAKPKKVHFIGVGGIGTSALARMFLLQGKQVSGSDRDESEITKELAKEGVKISIGQKAENIQKSIELVIYTIAIPDDNPELVRARELGIECVTYPQALGALSEEKYTIAVSGTHGKTTTTAMIAKILIDGKKDPTVVVGSLMKGTNFIAGKSKYLVAEACEYKRSFLNLSPKILVITNIDDDHLDYYKDIEDIKSAFRELALKVPKNGYVVCDLEQPHIADVVKNLESTIIDYELFEDQNLNLKIPGEHNIANAGAALAVADILTISRKQAEKSLEEFSGTWRRSEFKGALSNGAQIYDDYAHHPTEIKATLKGFREMLNGKNLTVVFQPHLYSRTKHHLTHFGEVFTDADTVILAPIYPAREPHDPSISSDMVAERIRTHGVTAMSMPSFDAIENHLRQSLNSSGDVLITMGAGDVYKIAENLLYYSNVKK